MPSYQTSSAPGYTEGSLSLQSVAASWPSLSASAATSSSLSAVVAVVPSGAVDLGAGSLSAQARAKRAVQQEPVAEWMPWVGHLGARGVGEWLSTVGCVMDADTGFTVDGCVADCQRERCRLDGGGRGGRTEHPGHRGCDRTGCNPEKSAPIVASPRTYPFACRLTLVVFRVGGVRPGGLPASGQPQTILEPTHVSEICAHIGGASDLVDHGRHGLHRPGPYRYHIEANYGDNGMWNWGRRVRALFTPPARARRKTRPIRARRGLTCRWSSISTVRRTTRSRTRRRVPRSPWCRRPMPPMHPR